MKNNSKLNLIKNLINCFRFKRKYRSVSEHPFFGMNPNIDVDKTMNELRRDRYDHLWKEENEHIKF